MADPTKSHGLHQALASKNKRKSYCVIVLFDRGTLCYNLEDYKLYLQT
jgi:hypothetical protein